MLQKFIDRAKELEFLERHFKREVVGFIVLYGRRQIGKTELLNRFRWRELERRDGERILEVLKEKAGYGDWHSGTVEFSSEIAKSLNFTAEHTENAEAPENLCND